MPRAFLQRLPVALSVLLLSTGLVLLYFALLRNRPLEVSEVLPPVEKIQNQQEKLTKQTAISAHFVTGLEKGDRGLLIRPDGTAILQEYGHRGSLSRERTVRYEPGTLGRRLFLILEPMKLSIEVLDIDTLTLEGDSYHRSTR